MKSSPRLLTRRLTAPQDDSGIAMIAAIAAIAIISAFGAVVATLAVRNLDGSAVGRSRVQAIDAAEAGIDKTYALLEAGTTDCQTSADLADTASYSVTVAYYDASGSAIDCDDGTVASMPAQAEITSVGKTTQPYANAPGSVDQRTMKSRVRLHQAKGFGYDHAIFSDAGITTTNDLELISSDVEGGLYTNGNFGCNSKGDIQGSVVTHGTAYLTNTCHVHGDLWARDKVTMDSTPIVDGSVYSKTAGAAIGKKVTIGKDLVLAGNNVWTWGEENPPSIGGNVSANHPELVPDRLHKELPKITFQNPDWDRLKGATGLNEDFQTKSWEWFNAKNAEAEGRLPTNYNFDLTDASNYCTVAHGKFNNLMVSPTQPTVLNALDDCDTLTFNGSDVDLKLQSDLVIFANDFYSTNGLSVESADGQPHRLWIIIPWKNANEDDCSDSGSGNIKFDAGGTDLDDSNVSLFLYSPGKIYLTNQMHFHGQVYGCQVQEDSSVHITYVPIGVPGVPGGGSTGYTLDIAYKQEVPNSSTASP